MISKQQINLFWFRRDLRLHDNAGLFHALSARLPVLPIFIFDTDILDKLDNKLDRRVKFIHQSILNLQAKILQSGSSLLVYHGKPIETFQQIINEFDICNVYTNDDYEPYALERDRSVKAFLNNKGIGFHAFKDHVIFGKTDIMKNDHRPYSVFTPYSKKWKSLFQLQELISFNSSSKLNSFHKLAPHPIPSLHDIGFLDQQLDFPTVRVPDDLLKKYSSQRDFPAIAGTSRLSVHLRFGTISIRELVNRAEAISESFLNELIWREFYQMIVWNFPQIGAGYSFKPAYDQILWRNNELEFERWCSGNTGYPIVDAGMRELNATGFMHNRVRMIVASFLCKHLLIDWRWGESYFAANLLDFEFASNNGGWQWASGSGCDAAPYFRIFNPRLQTKKFDSQLKYISKWVPELNTFGYPAPIVDHEFARKRCLQVYQKALRTE